MEITLTGVAPGTPIAFVEAVSVLHSLGACDGLLIAEALEEGELLVFLFIFLVSLLLPRCLSSGLFFYFIPYLFGLNS